MIPLTQKLAYTSTLIIVSALNLCGIGAESPVLADPSRPES